ncbi:MAG: hypothetical protein ACXVJO_12640 [Thermoanaerobaculia bacterium]
MRILLILGVILLVLGIASLFVPIPHRVRHGVQAGPVSFGVETTEKTRVHPAVTAVLIGGGIALMIVGGRKR